MLYGVLIFVHIIACVVLIAVVLIQAGRGGGLTDSFSSAESIFGTKTNSFLVRSTTTFAIIFFITCVSLAFVSKQRSRSLLEGKVIEKAPQETPAADSSALPAQGANETDKNALPPETPPLDMPEAASATKPEANQETPITQKGQ